MSNLNSIYSQILFNLFIFNCLELFIVISLTNLLLLEYKKDGINEGPYELN